MRIMDFYALIKIKTDECDLNYFIDQFFQRLHRQNNVLRYL